MLDLFWVLTQDTVHPERRTMEIGKKTIHPATENDILMSAGQKYTNVPLLPSFLAGLAGGALTVALAYLLKGMSPYFHSLIMERGPVQFLTVFGFWFTGGMLVFKSRNLKNEKSAFGLDFIKSFTAGREMLGTKTFIGQHHLLAENLDPAQKDLILVRRINKAIKQIRINKNPADVANVLTTVAETDGTIMDSSYVPIKFMIWALPILGFIGTIMGMTQAIGSFDMVLRGISEVGFSGVKQNLALVTNGLSVAFETTFLALVLSAVVNLFSNALQKQEEDFLSDVEEFTIDNIINKYTTLRDRISPSHMENTTLPEKKASTDSEGILRELKNMNRQQKVNADELMAQIGRLIEALHDVEQEKGDGGPPNSPGSQLKPILTDLAGILKGQQEFINEMKAVSGYMQKNMEVMDKLPGVIEEMGQTSKKLGELFSKIYNRSFL
jgi:biopolymer transport protein ExbB/TolQ